MNWIPTNGTQPRVEADKLFVRYRCGMESKVPYTVKTVRWRHNQDSFDVTHYRVPEA